MMTSLSLTMDVQLQVQRLLPGVPQAGANGSS